MNTWVWIVIAVAAVVVLALVLAAWTRTRRRGLQQRFGPEYDRTVERADSRREATKDLRERVAQHEELDLRPLSDDQRERYVERWNELQGRFVDRPQLAVADADGLVTEVMRERGYPVDQFEEKSRLVSVEHPDVVENYRRGHAVYEKTVEGRASTEDLRQAVVCYRALFEELVRDSAHA